MNTQIQSESNAPYVIDGSQQSNVINSQKLTQSDKALIDKALAILNTKIRRSSALTSAEQMRQYLRLYFADCESEKFTCLFLDQRHRPISIDDMFFGTIDGATVYPREIVKRALYHNAAAIVFAHNHPSGVAEPSLSDERITQRLKEALSLVDIRVLDHLVIGDEMVVSFEERGLI